MTSYVETNQEEIYAKRRLSLNKQMPGTLAIFASSAELRMDGDVSVPYRQDPDYLYLTGCIEPGGLLVLETRKGKTKSVLYLVERNPERERWDGPLIGLSKAKQIFHVDEVRDRKNFSQDLPTLAKGLPTVSLNWGSNPDVDNTVWRWFSEQKKRIAPSPLTLGDSRVLTLPMRLKKEPLEIEFMKKAIWITGEALGRVCQADISGLDEKTIASRIELEFTSLGSEHVAFPTIVASGKNAVCLHHSPSRALLKKGSLVLIDCGATWKGYNADITRTYPIAGQLSPAQSQVYSIVRAAMRKAIRAAKPGATLARIHKQAAQAIDSGLRDLGILKQRTTTATQEEDSYKKYFMHGTSHLLGLSVHERVPPLTSPHGDLLDPKDVPLPENSVLTIEPGLYFPVNDTSIPKEFRGIGIRLEDDIRISAQGAEILSGEIPFE